MEKSSKPPARPWDWTSAILVFLMVEVAASRLVITDWTPNLYFTQTLGAFGAVLGLALGASRFGRRSVRLMGWLYSLVVLPWQLTAAIEAEAPFAEKLLSVGGRLIFSLGQFLSRKPVDDALFFVALVSLGFWLIGLTAGYAHSRHDNTLGVLLPAGVATLIVQIYDGFVPVRIWTLGIYIFLGLVYVGRTYLRHNRQNWSEQHVFVTTESSQDLARSLLVVTAVTVFLAWSLPISITSLRQATNAWERMVRPIRERLNNAVTSLESPYGTSGQGDFYSESLAMGSNAAVGDNPVFRVTVATPPEDEPPRYYWRGRVYDTYRNGKWSSLAITSHDFDPLTEGVDLPITEAIREEARFTVTMQLARQGLLYTPSSPFWVNRPGIVNSNITPGRGEDVTSWLAEPALLSGDIYQVRSWVSSPTIEDLREAGTDYPAWVKSRYLNPSLPDPLLNELAPLALQVTEGAETPYDRAQAITAYLRDTLEYTITMPTPPKGVDPILWALNDYKKGFCMYYATAEVLMLRSIGIPARMAVGFAQGEQDPVTGVYRVLRKDSHAWPEVYFPDVGWVEFEPTGNQDPLVRPNRPLEAPTPIGPGLDLALAGDDPLDRESRADEEGVTDLPAETATPTYTGLLTGLGLLLVGILIAANQRFGLVERLPSYIARSYNRSGSPVPRWVRRWEAWTHLNSIERSFHAVNYSLNTLGRPQAMHITPAQRAALLQTMLPSAGPHIETLLHEHQASLYTKVPGSPALARRAAFNLLGHTLKARLREAWDRFDSRFDRTG